MLSFRVIVALHPCRPVFSILLSPLNPVLRILFQVPYSVTPVFAALTKTVRVWGILPILENLGASATRSFSFIQALSFHTLAHSFALTKNSTRLFSNDSALFTQKHRGWGTLALGSMWPRVPRIQGRMMLWL